MQVKHFLTFLLILLFVAGEEPQIIDFTYTHVLQEGGASSARTDKIIIFPDTKQIEKYSFPEICQLKEKLDEGMNHSSANASSVDVDEHLRELRGRILELLRLTEEMKNVRTILSEINEEYEPNIQVFNSTAFTLDLKRLADKQHQLAALKTHIETSTLKLNHLIEQYNLNPKNQQFNQVSLRYKISFADRQIDFYSNLKKSVESKKTSKSAPVNFTAFFADLEEQFKGINSHLDDIDSVINNYALKKSLEEKIASWRNKIQIQKLLLNQKVDCNRSKGKIRNHNHFNEEIKKTFKDLRQKKKEFNGMNNTQCEGVAKKLEEKIRSQLKIINRAFICSEGLEEIQLNLRNKEAELQNLQQKLEELKLGELEVYQRNYNNTVDGISKEFEAMKAFKVDEYMHSEVEIDKLLEDARQAKDVAQKSLNALPDASQSTSNFKDLQRLVQEIKREKAKYCKQYSVYEQDSHQIWGRIHQQQKRQRQLAHLRSQYIVHGQKFIALEAQYKRASGQIIEYLEQRQQIE